MDVVIEDGTAAVQARLGHQFLLDFFGAAKRVDCVEWLGPGRIREHGPCVMSGPLRLPGVLSQLKRKKLADHLVPPLPDMPPLEYRRRLASPEGRAAATGLAQGLTALLAQYCGLIQGE